MMRELIVGVTKIRHIGEQESWHIAGKGVLTYIGVHGEDDDNMWLDKDGKIFSWGVTSGEGVYWEFVDGNTETIQPTKEKSTGGSSNYYKITLPDWMIEKHKSQGFIMLEDLAEVMFDNDFNYVNVFKAQKRMFELEKGGGKEGNSFEYDATKSKYYIDKQVEVFNRK